MAKFPINTPIPAGTTVDVLQNWNFQIPPKPGRVRLLAWTTATGLRHLMTSLDRTIIQEGPVSAGAAAAQLPSELNVDPVIENVPGGQKLQLNVTNTTGGTLNYLATIDFAGGGKR